MVRIVARFSLLLLCAFTGLALLADIAGGRQAVDADRAGFQPTRTTIPIALAEGLYRIALPHVFVGWPDLLAGANPFGIEVPGGLGESADAVRKSRVQGLGASWIRWNRIRRAQIEKSAGSYDFSATDAALATLAGTGLSPIVVVADNPTWAGGGNGPLSDDQLPVFAAFMGALVNRYKDPPYNVKYWEIYNEPDNLDPNLAPYQGGMWGGNGAQYARMLQAVYPAVKAADPTAKVVFGGLALDYFKGDFVAAGETFPSEVGSFDPDFLEDALGAGAGAWFDVMNFHYYPEYDWRWNRIGRNSGHGPGIAGKAGYVRDRLAAYGLESKPLICTEIGVSSSPYRPAEPPPDLESLAPPRTDPRYWKSSSEEEQSQFVVRSLARGLAKGLEIMVWYPLADARTAGEVPRDSFDYHGLVENSLNPKPAYRVFQRAVQQLSGAQFVRAAGLLDLGTADVEGYLFRMPDGRQQWVLWSKQFVVDSTNAGRLVPLPVSVTLKTPTATVIEKDGTSATITSGNPLVQYVTFEVGGPVYVVIAE